jgi:hypothetical protein
MIKKYQKFLEELTITMELNPQEAFRSFVEILNMVIRKLRDDSKNGEVLNGLSSYSHIAKQNRKWNRTSFTILEQPDPEANFKQINDLMSKKGWNFEVVKQLISEFPNFWHEISHSIRPDPGENIERLSVCAAVDYYFYKISEGKWQLGGQTWGIKPDDEDTFPHRYDLEPETNEVLIKMGYGWHKTPYGQLFINQMFKQKGVRGFLEKALDYAPKFIGDLLLRSLGYAEESLYDLDEEEGFSDCFTVEGGSCYIETDTLWEFLKDTVAHKKLDYKSFIDLIKKKAEEDGFKTLYTTNSLKIYI